MPFTVGIDRAIVMSAHTGFQPWVGSVGVTDGRIEYVGERRLTAADCAELIPGEGRVLMPGLVNGHCHGDMTVARGLGEQMTLQQQQIAFADHGWFSKWLTSEDLFYSRQLTYIEALLGGTTFILENSFWNHPDAVAAMSAVGIRGAIAMDIRPDFSEPDVLVTDVEIVRFAAECAAAGILPVMGSISEEDFTAERLAHVGQMLAAHGHLVTSHLAETKWRDEISREVTGLSPVRAMAEHGFFDDRHIGSHMVQLDADDIALVAERGVKVVCTPGCEMKIADGIAPVAEMLQAGIPVSLGTDGALWSNSNDLFRELRATQMSQNCRYGPQAVSNADILRMATINGAITFGQSDAFGTIEAGKSADFILVDMSAPRVRPLSLSGRETVSAAVTGLVTAADVTDVFVRGERVVAGRRLETVDTATVLDHVQAAHERIAAAVGEES